MNKETINIIPAMKKTSWFSYVPETLIEQLCAKAIITKYESKEIIFYENHGADFLHILLMGYVKIYQTNEKYDQRIINVFGERTIIAAASSFNSQPFPATCETIVPCIVVKISIADIIHLIFPFPEILMKIINHLSELLLLQAEGSRRRSYHSALAKVSSALLYLSQYPSIYFNRDIIAEITGHSREQVSRELNKLAKEGVITLQHKKIVITDRPSLEAYLGKNMATTPSMKPSAYAITSK